MSQKQARDFQRPFRHVRYFLEVWQKPDLKNAIFNFFLPIVLSVYISEASNINIKAGATVILILEKNRSEISIFIKELEHLQCHFCTICLRVQIFSEPAKWVGGGWAKFFLTCSPQSGDGLDFDFFEQSKVVYLSKT